MDSKAPFLWPKAQQILGWLVGAQRPLTWYEMQAILSFEPDSKTVDFDLNMLRNDVTDMLGTLVHFIPGHSIRLIHPTAKK